MATMSAVTSGMTMTLSAVDVHVTSRGGLESAPSASARPQMPSTISVTGALTISAAVRKTAEWRKNSENVVESSSPRSR